MSNGQPKRHVAILVESSNRYARGLLVGIGSFVRTHPSWTVSLVERSRGQHSFSALRSWRGDGIIARIDHPAIAEAILTSGAPVVDLCAERLLTKVPWIETDDRAIVALALEHLLDRGVRSVAFIGERHHAWTRSRRHFLIAQCRGRLIPCRTHILSTTRCSLDEFLQRLPMHTGVLCSYDLAGMQVLDTARRLGIAVPDHLAVLGIDDDEAVCALCSPPLSSIALDAAGAGVAAARLLERMMDGKSFSSLGHLLPPLRLIERESTSGFASADPIVTAAVTAMRRHAARSLPIPAAARVAGVSVRTLEQHFRRVLGRSPHAEQVRCRLQAISRLLAESDLSLAEVATHCGFMNPEYLQVFIKREVGMSPGSWRRSLRGNPTSGATS